MKIQIIDDNDKWITWATETLTGGKHTVTDQEPDLVFINVRLLRNNPPDCQFIAITDDYNVRERERIEADLFALDYQPRTFNPDMLFAWLGGI
ncbi:MAG: hypothetical protein ACYTBZ_28945 [Planctomycetota bacterium]|jgi:hypothetical protein